MRKTVQIKKTNRNSVVHQMVEVLANRLTLNVLVENAYRADGNVIMKRIVMITVTSMLIAL